MISLLTRGSLVRGFVGLLWLIALIMRIADDAERAHLAAILLVFATSFLYISVGWKFPLLAHYSMSALLPNYFAKLKKALVSILLFSFIPTLILLPHFSLWLATLSALLFIAITFISATYNSKVYAATVLMFFIPYSAESAQQFLGEVSLATVLATSFPILVIATWYLLSKLETFKPNEEHIKQLINYSNSDVRKILVNYEVDKINSSSKVSQWFQQGNLADVRKLISLGKPMSNRQLIAVACRKASDMGKYSYISWLGMGVIVWLIAINASDTFRESFKSMLIILPLGYMVGGITNVAQTVNSKKALLARLSITPRFTDQYSFSRAFIAYIVSSQFVFLLLGITIVAIITFIFSVFGTSAFISITATINLVLLVISLCLLNVALLLWAWTWRQSYDSIVHFMQIIGYVCFAAATFNILTGQVALWQSPMFIGFTLLCLTLFGLSCIRHYRVGLRTA